MCLKFIQSYSDLQCSVEKLNDLCSSRLSLQKIISTPHFLVIKGRSPGKNIFINIGRGQNFQGIYTSAEGPKSEFRVNDRFREFFKKQLLNTFLVKIELHSKDRIVFLHAIKKNREIKVGFFWKGNQLYFAYYEKRGIELYLLKSWIGKIEKIQIDVNLKDIFEELGVADVSQYKSKINPEQMDQYHDNYSISLEKLLCNKVNSSRFNKKLSKKIRLINLDLEKIKVWKELQGKLIKSELNLDGEIFKFKTFSIKFGRGKSIFEKRDMLFNKIKNLKQAQIIQEKRLNLAISNSTLSPAVADKKKLTVKHNIISPVWHREIKANTKIVVNDNRNSIKIFKCSKITIALGLNSQGNDYLRTQWAHKDFFWFHLDGYPSAHIAVNLKNASDITPSDFELLASILRDTAKLTLEVVPIVFTQIKNLKGVKGFPGKVILKKEKRITVSYCNDWTEIISSY